MAALSETSTGNGWVAFLGVLDALTASWQSFGGLEMVSIFVMKCS